ncbi:phosphatase PAP2 family protein [Alkalihalophilus pseudofirmus]|uniref:phosphatase PAP2 family protein n=1 Tax=Alkalihalophilus pseudofirmus TaxID=79885 RepID=UPI00259B470C|nr:phosphatase PAP2 family protein [Alkalihalophilus pseudofirmus]WEG16828.1 phosphatase PAP2 family protein [Alkalihalophilus pseudofirmus]
MDVVWFEAVNGLAKKSSIADAVMMFISSYGIYLMIGIILSFWLKKKTRRYALLFTIAVLAGLGMNRVLKIIIDRPRPFIASSDVHLLIERGASPSFPSNQALIAGIFVAAIWLITVKAWRYAALAFGGVVLLSRVFVGHHYPADVLVGFVLGSLLTYVFFMILRRIQSPAKIDTEQSLATKP